MTKKRVHVTSEHKVINVNGQEVSLEVIDLPERVEIGDSFWQLRFVRLPDVLPISFQELKQAMG